jgi:hypothetical protein
VRGADADPFGAPSNCTSSERDPRAAAHRLRIGVQAAAGSVSSVPSGRWTCQLPSASRWTV